VVKLTLGLAAGALLVSAASRLAATRSRNARLTPIRYTAPSLSWVNVPSAAHTWTSHVTIRWPSDMAAPSGTEFWSSAGPATPGGA